VRGRVRVTLGVGHPRANTGGWQYRYRLVVLYALGADALLPGQHVDHVNGVVDHDEIENLRVLDAEYHGRWHAFLFETAGMRDPETGQFGWLPQPRRVDARRFAAIIQALPVSRDCAWMLSPACRPPVRLEL
jgi:hypothetical protein